MHDHKFDEYYELSYWDTFYSRSMYDNQILEIQIQSSKLYTENASDFLTSIQNLVYFLHFGEVVIPVHI